MARGRIAGITIEINGDPSGFTKSLKTVDSSLNQTQRALRDVNKLLKFNPGNTELLTQKQRYLKKAVEDTRLRLQQLKDAARNVTPESIGQEKYDALQREIVETESKLKNLEAEMRNFGSVSAQKIALVGEKMKALGSKMQEVGKTMTATVTVPIVAGFTMAAKSASDYEENLNKIDVAFGESSDSVKEWANNALKEFGLSKVAATSAVSSFGALGKGVGLAEKEAADMSTTLAGLSADLASYFNTSTDDSAKALEGIFTGEAESLKKFGVVMNETNLKQFAEDQGLVYSEMSQAEKVMLRYQFVLAKTGDAQGDYARTSDGTANSIKTFKAALEDLATAIGTQLLPIITPIIQKITQIIQKFNELSPQTQKIITIIGLVVAAVGPLLIVFGALFSAIGSILTVWPMLVGAIAAISAPVMIAVGVIAGLIAIGVLLYRNWDTIKAKAIELKDKLSKEFDRIKQKIQNALNNIINTFTNTKNKVVGIVNGLKTSVSNAFSGITNAIKSKMDAAKNAVSNAISRIKSILSGSISFPHIEVPHFHISGGELPWGIGGKGTPPDISVEWYKKAMNQPYVLDGATIFGAMNGRLLGGGESGKEAILSLDSLKRYAGNTVVEVHMTVNGAKGQDVNVLADRVAEKIYQQVRRAGA